MAHVVADHIRNLTFAITDEPCLLPSGEGVCLAVSFVEQRYGQEILGAPNGFHHPRASGGGEFQQLFPELKAKQAYVMSVLADEESTFVRTLDRVLSTSRRWRRARLPAAPWCLPRRPPPVQLPGLPHGPHGAHGGGARHDRGRGGLHALMEEDCKISEKARSKGGSSKDMTMEAEQTSWLQSNGVGADAEDKYLWNEDPTVTVTALFTGAGRRGPAFRNPSRPTTAWWGWCVTRHPTTTSPAGRSTTPVILRPRTAAGDSVWRTANLRGLHCAQRIP